MTAHLGTDGSPLVVHVIPSPLGRGAQRAARILVDRLDEPGVVRHRLLGLFDGPPEVELDLALGHPGGSHAAEGFQPRLALRLRSSARTAGPGGGGGPWRRPDEVRSAGSHRHRAPVGLLRHRHLRGTADATPRVGMEAHHGPGGSGGGRRRRGARRVHQAFRSGRPSGGRDTERARPVAVPSPVGTGRRGRGATLIFVGALTPQKQPDRFVEVVGRLRAEGRSFRAMLVGDGPLAGPLADSAAAHGVELLGSRSDVPELLRRSDVLVFTSRPTGEGMPGVLIEAGLSGLPAVSTPVPGAATVLADGRTGVIVDDSVGAMAEAVGQLLDDPVRRAAMGAAARSRCESEFTLDLMAERWRAALQPMVGAQDGSRSPRPGASLRRGRAIAFRRSMRARRGQLPLVAGRTVARSAGNAQQHEEERQHHRSLAGDQAQVPQGGEGVQEGRREEQAHGHVGPGQRHPGQHAQLPERCEHHHQQHGVLQRLIHCAASVGVDRQRIEQDGIDVLGVGKDAGGVAEIAAPEPGVPAAAVVVLGDLR